MPKEEKTKSSKTKSTVIASNQTEKESTFEKFQHFDSEYQLAIIVALLNRITVSYDYLIGNPEFLLKSEMTSVEIKDMKELLVLIEEEDEDLRKFSATHLALFDEFKAKDKAISEIASFEEIHANYLATVEEMVRFLADVTPKNTQESRERITELKAEYLMHHAQGFFLTALEIVNAAQLDEAVYLKSLTKFIEKEKE